MAFRGRVRPGCVDLRVQKATKLVAVRSSLSGNILTSIVFWPAHKFASVARRSFPNAGSGGALSGEVQPVSLALE